ncbi:MULTISPECIES: acetyl-CoA C-acetyltransferase [Bacillus cereus group]|uniref:acetyl-CoA C-acetyltransferase n=1 Tax=Bacillus TaxID=1386 RepID=UPI0001A0C502|nr:Acetyl-CoA acetyltransferase [Bacillus cereus Rock3-28]MBJ7949472.1 acetyl-CoA C-acetyltransferase [Bacillus cereus group sp. N24]MBJ8133724.1 acetyl-CoA C-acetyltransferase [Bacillus cereus group sp. N3]PDZ90997.1 acetyl-CoA C-acyltransferase [Bacillus thuringiensis]PEB26731.1 acetyl-CoA C-acyltransferase [Bacillus toyonensis]
MTKTVILSAARTPIGKLGGALKDVKATELGGIAIKAALERGNVSAGDIEEVIFGTVIQGGQGQIPSRQAARAAGIPWKVQTETVNKVCASGLRAVTLADQIIRTGDKTLIVAGGMESMSNGPYVLQVARWGYRMGNNEVVDLNIADGLTCAFSSVHMGVYGGEVAKEDGISREAQDKWSYRSHQRAVIAQKEGRFEEEIMPVVVPRRKGNPVVITKDESPREDTTIEKLMKLKPVFDKTATITAGNSPGLNDGGAALVLMSEDRAWQEGRQPIATILAHTAIAVESKNFPRTPGYAINELLKKTGKTIEEIDLFEINEAFAAVAIASAEIAGINPEKVNVNGGAVAMGHPIGAGGARIIVTLIHALKQRGGGIGIASICSGGGQGDAIMIEV